MHAPFNVFPWDIYRVSILAWIMPVRVPEWNFLNRLFIIDNAVWMYK